jgi:LemA protein
MAWIPFVVLAALVLLVIGMYNTLVRLKVQSENAWADIDVQLKRRYDLIPNLIETVKGYAGHEKQTLEAVITARNRAMTATTPASKGEAEGVLAQSLKSLFALAEAYPQLRAVESFTQLQGSLNQIEEAVQNARRYYLNTRIQEFPSNFIANFFSFKTREFFEIADVAERAVPKVSFEQASR